MIRMLLFGLVVASALSVTMLGSEQKVQTESHMTPGLQPGFAVATIKPSDPGSTRGGFPTEGHHVACYNETVASIITVAYNVHVKQVVGGPDWIYKDRFDIEGIPDQPGIPDLTQLQGMYRKLLAERFRLMLGNEERVIPIYALTVAKGGPLLKQATPSEALNTSSRGNSVYRQQTFTAMPLEIFALNLNFYEDRPVIDETHLAGAYDFTLSWTFDLSSENSADTPPSLFTAIKEQLGLKVEPRKSPVKVLVVKQVNQPSAN